MVMDLPPNSGKSTALKPQGIPPETEHKSLMERLRLLRELKDEGLISEEDFQGKLRTLVDEENATVPDSKDRLRFLKELREKGVISEGEHKNKVHEILEAL
jgi:NurA-like 5'-3' nuclease